MLEKYISFFDGLSAAERVLRMWGYTDTFIEKFPRNVAMFVLIGVCLGIVKIFLLLLHLLPNRSRKMEIAEERVKGEIKLFGVFGGGIANLAMFLGMMAVNMGRAVPGFLRETFSSEFAEGVGFTIFARIVTIVVALLYLAVICGLFTPIVICFVNNMKIYGIWGIFETILSAFLGISALVVVGVMLLAGALTMLPFYIYMFCVLYALL